MRLPQQDLCLQQCRHTKVTSVSGHVYTYNNDFLAKALKQLVLKKQYIKSFFLTDGKKYLEEWMPFF